MSEAGSIADYAMSSTRRAEKRDDEVDSRSFIQRVVDDVCGEAWERSMMAAIRAADRMIGPPALPFVLLPWIAVDVLRRARDYRQFCRLRSTLPQSFWKDTGPLRHYLRMITHWQRSMALCVVADRASEARWQRRIQVSGLSSDELKEWSERPVIIACLHTGGFTFLRHWLRAHGKIAASLLRARPRIIRRYEEKRRRQRTDAEELPSYIEVYNIRSAIRYLVPGRILTLAIEAQPEARARTVNLGAPLRVGDGAARLARATGAMLLPASVWLTRNVEIRFRRPVPQELLDSGNIQAVNEFLARELWTDLERDPCAIGWTTLEAYAPQNLVRPRTRWP